MTVTHEQEIGYILETPIELLIETFLATTDYKSAVGRDVDPWSYFGVPEGASQAAIKRSYHKVAQTLHPDKLVGMPPAKRARLSNEFKRATVNYRLLTGPVSGKILKVYGTQGWRVYKTGDSMAIVREKLMKRYALRYGARDPLGPHSDPLRPQLFRDPFIRSGVVEERLTFDPNSTANEGRWRLRNPQTLHRYFRRASTTPGVSYVVGRNRATGDEVIQAVRFDKVIFTEREAARWWLKNKKKDKFKRLWTWKGK